MIRIPTLIAVLLLGSVAMAVDGPFPKLELEDNHVRTG